MVEQYPKALDSCFLQPSKYGNGNFNAVALAGDRAVSHGMASFRGEESEESKEVLIEEFRRDQHHNIYEPLHLRFRNYSRGDMLQIQLRIRQ
jgi:hypothetical protein